MREGREGARAGVGGEAGGGVGGLGKGEAYGGVGERIVVGGGSWLCPSLSSPVCACACVRACVRGIASTALLVYEHKFVTIVCLCLRLRLRLRLCLCLCLCLRLRLCLSVCVPLSFAPTPSSPSSLFLLSSLSVFLPPHAPPPSRAVCVRALFFPRWIMTATLLDPYVRAKSVAIMRYVRDRETE